MWWLSLSPYIVPSSATAAGLFTWLVTRGRRPSDGDLLRHFLVALLLLLVASAGVMQLDSVRNRWDPGTKARTEFMAMPLHQAWKRHFPNEWKPLETAAIVSFTNGQDLPAVMAQVRGLHPLLARKMLPSAQGTAVIGYADALVPVMHQLKTADAPLCVRMAWRHVSEQPFDYGAGVSPEVQAAYQAAIVQVLASNSRAQEGSWKPEVGASQRQAVEAWTTIVANMPARYANLMQALHTPEITKFDPAVVCEASIQALSQAAAQPAPVARELLVMLLAGTT
jgi:hypothetical protein